MASRRPSGAREEMIHCEFCGEDYAASYKRCPFCDGRPPSEDGESGLEETGRINRSGRRVTNNTRGGGYGGSPSPKQIVGTVISVALIIAAICIVISFIKPLIDRGDVTLPDPSATLPVEPSQDPIVSQDPSVSQDPALSIPPDQTATGFTLSKTDFTMNDKYPEPISLSVTFIPAGSTGTITWSSSDTDVATVDSTGKVSHGTKSGTATITATMAGGVKQECTVRCNFSGTSISTGTGTNSGSGTSTTSTLSLNHTDFSFSSKSDPSVQMKVSGTSSTPTWSIGNSSVATITSSGVVNPVGTGSTTITCTVDGKTLTCIVRCHF